MIRGRGLIGALLIASLLGSLAMQTVVRQSRERLAPRLRSNNRLTGLDTFALGLVLGGLRGPLVMALWTSAETAKSEKNLEDIDTKIEMIRMLQPEFDSVHIFQIWNKAYNISVQMASLPNKYATILDALDYAGSVDGERPDNINILTSIGDLYFNKLGSSPEKKYYMDRVRRDTSARQRDGRPHAVAARNLRRLRLDPMLDAEGYILPQLLQPKFTLTGPAAKLPDHYNGAELQYLARYNTAEMGGFPYGLSPLALGTNYYKRAGMLMAATGQKHVQVSESLIDSRPAIILRNWSEEELERAARAEMAARGKTLPAAKASTETRADVLASSAAFPLDSQISDTEQNRGRLREALFGYGRANAVAQHAEAEYRRHINSQSKSFNVVIYNEHVDIVKALAVLAQADHDYLASVPDVAKLTGSGTLTAPQIQQLRQSALRNYRQTVDLCYYVVLRYETDDVALFTVRKAMGLVPEDQQYDKGFMQKVDPKRYPEIHQACVQFMKKNERPDPRADDALEYLRYIQHAMIRLQALQG